MKLLRRLNDRGMTVFMVTHSPECAEYAKRKLTVSDGAVVGDSKISVKVSPSPYRTSSATTS
jgi:putative ABC transport system ATP-binding protein